jgi:hypothetical protein
MIIYKATNLINNKFYIGKTIQTFEKRKTQHIYVANLNNKRDASYFHRALKKYGKENFKWEIVNNSCLSEIELSKLEQSLILSYKKECRYLLYNTTDGGDGASGLVHSEKTKKRLSIAHKGQIPWAKGKKFTEETRQKMSEAHKGKKHSEEQNEKQREIMKGNQYGLGRKPTEESIQKMRQAQLGKKHPHTEEAKRKMSIARKGIPKSEEWKRKIGESNKNKIVSEETRKKISESHKLRRCLRELNI